MSTRVNSRSNARTHRTDQSQQADGPRQAPATDGTGTGPVNATPDGFDADHVPGHGDVEALGSPGVLSGTQSPADVHPAKLKMRDREKIDVEEPSGIVALGNDEYLVVDDQRGVYFVDDRGDADRIGSARRHDELEDLEGICLAPDGESVYVVSEGNRKIYQLALERDGNDVDVKSPDKVGQLPKLGPRNSNNGWEGLSVFPGEFFPDGKPRMVAVHEDNPRRIGIFEFPDFENATLLKLPREAKRHLPDLSGVAVDPKTGHLFVLSDEGRCVVEMRLLGGQGGNAIAPLEPPYLEVVGRNKLDKDEISRRRDDEKPKPEGICFDPDGSLIITMDGNAMMTRFDVVREPDDD